MADIFVSYTSSDRDRALWIAEELRALGHTPHVHELEVKGGDDIYGWMEARHDAADHVLCVVSDEYLKAPYSTLERNAALWQAVTKRPGFVLLVVVKPCRIPTLSDHLRRCELFDISEAAARNRFREFMTKRDAPEARPWNVFAVSNIPIRVPTHFLGREDALAEIETALQRYEGRVAITVLHGLRGVGKTTLAAAYAERHRGDLRATWWLRAQTAAGMQSDLIALGVRLGWIPRDEKEEPALAAVMERLRHEGEGILLIYDNSIEADTLKPFLPRGGAAQVLITSNAHAWRGVAELIEIRLWPAEIGADYLIARTDREVERAAAKDLSEALGGLPLAHEQAAAYCERLQVPLAEYRRRFEVTPARLLDDEEDAPSEYHDRLTVAKTFGLAIDEVAKLHPAAELLIAHVGVLPPVPIPLFLFAEGAKKFGEPLASMLADDGLDEMIAALRGFALVERETTVDEREPTITTDTIRLHRLVREIAVARRDKEAQERARTTLIEALALTYPEETDNSKVWPRARRLQSVAMDLIGDIAELKGPIVLELARRIANYSSKALGNSEIIEQLLRRELAIEEADFGPDHPNVSDRLSSLALFLNSRGDIEEVEPLYHRLLAIDRANVGPNHPSVARDLNNLALLLKRDLLRRNEAEPLFRQSLEIYKKVYGEQHILVALVTDNLAQYLNNMGRSGEAEELYRRALAIDEAILSPDDADIGRILYNLAGLLSDANRPQEAEPLYRRALTIAEASFGPEHYLVASHLTSLAMLLLRTGRTDEADRVFLRAIAIKEAILGPDNKEVRLSREWQSQRVSDRRKTSSFLHRFRRLIGV